MATHRVHWALNVEAPDSRSAAEIAWTQVLGQSPKPTTDDHCVFYVQPVRTPGDKPRKPGFVDLSTSPSSDIVDLAERRRTVVTPTDKAFLLDTMNDAADPDELVNIASAPEHADVVRSLRETLDARYDLTALEEDVVAGQSRRRLVQQALLRGRTRPWDFVPDPEQRYVRGDFWGALAHGQIRDE